MQHPPINFPKITIGIALPPGRTSLLDPGKSLKAPQLLRAVPLTSVLHRDTQTASEAWYKFKQQRGLGASASESDLCLVVWTRGSTFLAQQNPALQRWCLSALSCLSHQVFKNRKLWLSIPEAGIQGQDLRTYSSWPSFPWWGKWGGRERRQHYREAEPGALRRQRGNQKQQMTSLVPPTTKQEPNSLEYFVYWSQLELSSCHFCRDKLYAAVNLLDFRKIRLWTDTKTRCRCS